MSRTPNNFTPPIPPATAPPPREGQVRELCPLVLQCEQRRVMTSRRRVTREKNKLTRCEEKTSEDDHM